jgi:dihydroorotate dehydrogenase (NAD+) catalytic subunit
MANLTTVLTTRSSTISLPNPLIGASGSFGHSNELFDVIDPGIVGAITIKSLAPFTSPGNVSPRVAAVEHGMMNSVGLPGPHIAEWVKDSLPILEKSNGRFIMALWGRSLDEYSQAAEILAPHIDMFEAIEVNLSCPNTESGDRLYAQSADDTREIMQRVRKEVGDDISLSAKLTANVTRVTDIAQGAVDGGADMFTLFNTVMGLSVDPETRTPILGKGAGGYSGEGIFPIVQRGVFDVHSAFPDIPIIGTGGVSTGRDAASLMMCGASAVGVATATFADPRALIRIIAELDEFCEEQGIDNVADIVGTVNMSGGTTSQIGQKEKS